MPRRIIASCAFLDICRMCDANCHVLPHKFEARCVESARQPNLHESDVAEIKEQVRSVVASFTRFVYVCFFLNAEEVLVGNFVTAGAYTCCRWLFTKMVKEDNLRVDQTEVQVLRDFCSVVFSFYKFILVIMILSTYNYRHGHGPWKFLDTYDDEQWCEVIILAWYYNNCQQFTFPQRAFPMLGIIFNIENTCHLRNTVHFDRSTKLWNWENYRMIN